MTNPIGWVKLHRNLRNSFSSDRKLNIELWMLYVFLAEQAAWDDYGELKRGQIKIKARFIQDEIFPSMYLDRVRKLVRILTRKGYITSTPISNISKEGFIIEICQYESFSGELSQKVVKPNCNPTETQVKPGKLDNIVESFDNNHVNQTACNPSETQVKPNCNQTQCSYYIEERIKEEKEEKEGNKENSVCNFSDEKCATTETSLSIIKDEPKKPKKKSAMKEVIDHTPVIKAYTEAYEQRYKVKPLINGMVCRTAQNIIKRVGADKAPHLVRFYVGHSNAWYLQKAHSLEYCLKDCEKLHTEILKNDYIFIKDAKKVEDATAHSILKQSILSRFRNEGNDE